ncbi:bifunctional 4-hydroxy-2-oxoglutarate aldolase/2-dehydro-3-deoxy-phosphogluconate aldolase [Streptococcus sp. zg-86]|uniref:Bifunctional 4-hydroxy-2-oxoglutarate aldolase/2-dehydro-3-deoxy-phosphogluconate aldolase n=1 Tax=Streptococcus zhangguiae TaxID=2664091 RepID=A0A6I4RI81_9STRE|nr:MULTISPECIES: bifunctional 4-hydroxy-2-oxoglutarate aldolase/2-dehydro-3-deoxy-phosphogluconate aldolase [unclassified Streptococcus]MTB64530.1 bifunctional 4-hydroxy-2-oxoglutarate aldolase/2-dehydro-3-deoxy-phosphogluconate aldolase [Streptococcus sp. zg-86]MTB90780.1 bifunctional 4-hydroxy-2-oxoglutarate aldolase/2-dehydro-3-deoxy-phosphogluconate aldolase [Streptococcus sp. zg-36]MWV56517.1 bifunctional 4-hydroxy-2-oxoglutarate aldolase/2-dehydro-3-deoxy-phosphogluconate aldolase [Strepto
MLKQLKENYFFAVIRGKDENDALEIARHAILGGIKNIEITFSTPNAAQVIAELDQEFSDDLSVIVGAGTVMTTDLAQTAIDAGAKFLVSPHFSEAIQDLAAQHDVFYFPGCATATEIVAAQTAGCQIIKLFPGGVLGPTFIKDIHGPIPEVNLMPSGGVSVANVADWKKAGACAVGIGSALASKIAELGYESVTEIARSFVEAVEE